MVNKSKRKSKILNIAFILAVFIGLIIYIINVEGIPNIVHVLKTADYKWILIGIGCLLCEWILEAIVMHIPLKKMYPNHKYALSLQVNIVGRFFNNITPFSSGGQPFQAYVMSKYGLRVSDTFSVLMMKFVVYQVALFSWAIILLIANFQFFNQTFNNYMWLVVLGFLLNLIATLFILIAGINKKIILSMANGLIKIGSKIRFGKRRLIKDIDATKAKAEESISNYNKQFNDMRCHKSTIFKMYIFSMLQLLAYFSIPYMIYRAFGNFGITYPQVLLVQTYLLLIMSFIPTPGSGLGAEGGFALLYKTVFLTGLNMAILFWRVYTFYLPIIVGLFVFLYLNKNLIDMELDGAKEIQEND